MVENTRKKEFHWWWFEGHKNTKQSPWLQSTIEELDEKTKAMLRLIEEDAESFAQRAEMLYKKKPELIGMVEDFYRAHRSLAERYDFVKAEPVTRLSTPMASPRASIKSKSEKGTGIAADQLYDSYSISSISEDYNDSEMDDAEHESNGTQAAEKEPEHAIVSNVMFNEEVEKLRDEMGKLKEENRLHKAELLQKDEEKREVIRQLCIAIEMLKEEKVNLRQTVASTTKGLTINTSRSPALNKFNEFFSGILFSFGKPKSPKLIY